VRALGNESSTNRYITPEISQPKPKPETETEIELKGDVLTKRMNNSHSAHHGVVHGEAAKTTQS
jgi:hypothetical protein